MEINFWILLEMAHHWITSQFIQFVFLTWLAFTKLRLLVRDQSYGPPDWRLLIHYAPYRSALGAYNSDPLPGAWILPALINPGRKTLFMKLCWVNSKSIQYVMKRRETKKCKAGVTRNSTNRDERVRANPPLRVQEMRGIFLFFERRIFRRRENELGNVDWVMPIGRVKQCLGPQQCSSYQCAFFSLLSGKTLGLIHQFRRAWFKLSPHYNPQVPPRFRVHQ